MTNTYELFAKIIEARGITPYRISKDTGLTTVLFTDWKKGKSKPKYDKLKIIADYLGVSVEYLQGEETVQQEILDTLDNQNNASAATVDIYSEQEKTIIAMFRSTSEKGKLRIIQAIMNIVDSEKNGMHSVYRAARSTDNAEHHIENLSESASDSLKAASPVTSEEDL